MKCFINIIGVAIFIVGMAETSLYAGSSIDINRATYDVTTTTLTLDGLNFGSFDQLTISIGDSILNTCSVGDTIIKCDINGTPAVGGGSFHVKVSAGNSPNTNSTIDVYIPEGTSECSPGEMAVCYSGDPATLGSAECAVGYRYCQNDRTWGSCYGEVTPINEVCDMQDNDCDGQTDEDAVDAKTYYQDLDGDGYGNNLSALISCEPPSQQYIENGGDCNDNSQNVYPGAQEYCNVVDDDCDGVVDNGGECIADADEDGFFADIDCDDSNPNINPGLDETCDGIDNDCDSRVDEDAIDQVVWYKDSDSDGYGSGSGSGSGPILGCYPPQDQYQWSRYYTDCDDNDSNKSPGVTEICNGIDDNCSGVVDEGFTKTNWFRDYDGDGFGDKNGVPIYDCAKPTGYVTGHSDCDDIDSRVFPGQTEYFSTQRNSSGYDYDCNGIYEKNYTDFADYGWILGCQFYQEGWSPDLLSTVPSCGLTRPWVINASGAFSCEESIVNKTQECR